MPNRYAVAGRSANTAATIDQSAGHLWNPSTSRGIFVREVHVVQVNATASNLGLIRTTTIGTTPGTTVTPDVDNAFNRQAAPPSASVLYLATFATYPVVAGPYMYRTNTPAAGGVSSLWIMGDEPIFVPAGTGLAVATPVAVILQSSDISYVWDE